MHAGSDGARLAKTTFSRLTGDKKVNDSRTSRSWIYRDLATSLLTALFRSVPHRLIVPLGRGCRCCTGSEVSSSSWRASLDITPVVCLLFSIFLSFYPLTHIGVQQGKISAQILPTIPSFFFSMNKLFKVPAIVTNYYLFKLESYIIYIR